MAGHEPPTLTADGLRTHRTKPTHALGIGAQRAVEHVEKRLSRLCWRHVVIHACPQHEWPVD